MYFWRQYEMCILLASICAAVHSLAAVQQKWLLVFADFSVKWWSWSQCQVQGDGVSGTQDRDKDSQLMNCFVTCSSAFHVGGKIKLDTPNPHCAEGDKSIKQGFEEWSCYRSGDTPVHFSALFLWHLVNKPLNNNPLWWNFPKKYL